MTAAPTAVMEPINLNLQTRFESPGDLVSELKRQQDKKRDFLAPTETLILLPAEDKEQLRARHDASMRWRSLPAAARRRTPRPEPAPFELRVGEEGKLDAHPHALNQICQWIPSMRKDYWTEMARVLPGLVAENANQWFREIRGERLVRSLDGTFRAFQSRSYRIIDHYPVLEAVLRGLVEADGRGIQYEIREQSLSFSKMRIQVYFPGVGGEVRPGDEVCAFMEVSNSEVGRGSFDFRYGVFRLVCLNGMTTHSIVKQIHLGSAGAGAGADSEVQVLSKETQRNMNAALMGLTRDAVREVTRQEKFRQALVPLQTSAQLGIETVPRKAIEVTSSQFGLPEADQDGILAHLLGGGDLTQWGLVNAITRHAQDTQPDTASELEAAAGKIVELDPIDWSKISHAGKDLSERQAAVERHKDLIRRMASAS